MKRHLKTIVLSDIHLGTSGSKAKEVTSFLKEHSCEKLILNGDIIDGWQLKKYGKWNTAHTKFFRRILKMIEKDKTEVIYLRGNHDDFLDQIMPFKLGTFSIQREYFHISNGKKFYVIHGDVFDSITTNLKWVAKLGDIGYTFLLWINQQYNAYRLSKGLPYYSLSQRIKSRVKKAVSYISDFEQQLAKVAQIKKCDGIICGHIHQPAIKSFEGDTLYMNSGDWVESLSALIETIDGRWEIAYFEGNESISFDDDDDDDAAMVSNPLQVFNQDLEAFQSILKMQRSYTFS